MNCWCNYFVFDFQIYHSSKISIWKKGNLDIFLFLFLLLPKLILPFYSFTLFCIILPMTMFIPEAQLPGWVVCYVPALMSLLNVLPAPKSFPFIVPYLLFDNSMWVIKFNTMFLGFTSAWKRTYEWGVTKNVGRGLETDFNGHCWSGNTSSMGVTITMGVFMQGRERRILSFSCWIASNGGGRAAVSGPAEERLSNTHTQRKNSTQPKKIFWGTRNPCFY